MKMSELAHLRQKKRLEYIDLCAYVLGVVNRTNLMNRFNVATALASKDISLYQKESNSQLTYDHKLKGYTPKSNFSPLYTHSFSNAFSLIGSGKQLITVQPELVDNMPNYDIQGAYPDLDNIYHVFRALNLKTAVHIQYYSRSSGFNPRVIFPHSLLKTGTHTYVRSFDKLSQSFRSFKLNRISQSSSSPEPYSSTYHRDNDIDWSNEVMLDIRIHPDVKYKETINFDYGMDNGVLTVYLKKCLLHYFLMDWNIAPLDYKNLPSTLFPLYLHDIIEH